MKSNLISSLQDYIKDIKSEFNDIPQKRQAELKEFSKDINSKVEAGESINLTFICTHNSRRSHMAQLWAQVAAYYYGIKNVYCYSGGTEATAFNSRSVKALIKAGFEIYPKTQGENPFYHVKFAEDTEEIEAFSKLYDDKFNPHKNFFAVMTCSDADENCPVVFGAEKRISLTYEDPKEADDTAEEESRYDERSRQIAVEMFYLFSIV